MRPRPFIIKKRQAMKWIRKHRVAGTLIGILVALAVIVCLSLVLGKSGFGVFNRIYARIEKPLSSFGTSIKENVSGIFSYKELLEENKALKEENAKLSDELSRQTLEENELQELRDLSKALNYEFIQGETDLVTANVSAFDEMNWMNSFTIDRGSESGIAEGNIVICGEGLVGRISDVGKGWAKVLPIIDETSKVSFSINRNMSLLGIVEGSENGEMTGFMLDNNAGASEGDEIYTSGLGEYPAGIKIGRITKAGFDSDKQLVTISAVSEVDFSKLFKVSVII